MKRINGFIDLDSYFKDLFNSKDFPTDEVLNQKLVISSEYSVSHFWIEINGKSYYFKPTVYFYHELVCHEIADSLGIESLEYDLAEFRKQKGVISLNYRKGDCKYVRGNEILQHYYSVCNNVVNEMGLEEIDWKTKYTSPAYVPMNNLETIWQALEFKYSKLDKQAIAECMMKIILQFIFMILTAQYDKGSYNWEIEEGKNTINVVPLFDNEASFPIEDLGTEMSTGFQDFSKSQSEILERFLTISSQEYVDLFLEKFNTLTESKMLEIFSTVENKVQAEIPRDIKDILMNSFLSNRKSIEGVLNKLNIENKIGRR